MNDKALPNGDAGQYFRLIAENLTDMVAILDTDGKRLYCTPNYRLLGKPEDLAGSDSFLDIHPDDRAGVERIFRQTISTGVGQPAGYRLVLPGGGVRHIRSQGTAIKSADGRVEKVLVVSRDVTDEREAADNQRALELQLLQAEKLNSLGKTISGVAHELNNPLTGIMGYCQLLLRDEAIQEHSRHREDVTAIFREAERCQKIVRGLTAFARKHKPEKTYLGVNGLLADCMKLQESTLKVSSVGVTLDLAPELPKTMADFHQLEQVFMNLVLNARDAMEGQRRDKKLHISTRLRAGRILVCVEDNGPGIQAGLQDSVFEPFYTTKEAGKGTGLGLSISFGIISEHDGRIWTENAPSGGARFFVELPVCGPASDAAPSAQAPQPQALPGRRLLIIDDEQCVMDVCVRIARVLNMSPDIARDAETARRKLASCDYDAVLCDFRLPDATGLELYNWAVKQRPGIGARWAFITGSSSGADLAPSGRPVLGKPFTIESFEATVGALLAR